MLLNNNNQKIYFKGTKMAKKYYKYSEKNNSVHVFGDNNISLDEAVNTLKSISSGLIKDRESVIKFVTAASAIIKKDLIAEDMDKGLVRTKYYRFNKDGNKVSIKYASLRARIDKILEKENKPKVSLRQYSDRQVEEFWINVCNKYGFKYAGFTYNRNNGKELKGVMYSNLWINVGDEERKLSYDLFVKWKNGTTTVKWLDKQIRLTSEKVSNGVDNSMLKYNFKERIKEALSKVRKFFS